MKWSELFTSSIGKKWVMALTGIFLILFLVIHVGLNATIWSFKTGVKERKDMQYQWELKEADGIA